MAFLSARDVAHYFLTAQGKVSSGEAITNLKLQKLCYYAQGLALARLGRPLFFDDIQHWQHGPVVPALWREYRGFRTTPIPSPDHPLDLARFDANTKSILDSVIGIYGSVSAWELRNMTHTEAPWNDSPEGAPIPHSKMRAYFQALAENILSSTGEDAKNLPLALQVANDAKFMELTENGLDDLAMGRYSSITDVRRSLGNI